MKTAIFASAALSLTMLAGAPHANASIFTETYYGIIDSTVPSTFQSLPGQTFAPSVMDNANLFGGGDLTGYEVVATFTYDPSLGVLDSGHDYSTGYDYTSLDGGYTFGVSTPVTYADFKITNPDTQVTYDYGYVPDARGSAALEAGYLAANTANSLAGDESYVGLVTPAAPNDINTSFSSSTFPFVTIGSYLAPGATNTGVLDTITFDTFAVTVSGTPEASTWALMLVGVGGIGLMLRRPRRPAADMLDA